MSEVRMKGSRANLIGLLGVMIEELRSGESTSSTAFAEEPGWDPSNSLTLVVVEDQPHDTTLEVWR